MTNTESVNRCILIGRVDGQPSLRETRDRKAYCTFRLRTETQVGDSRRKTWHSITVWNEVTARFVGEYAVDGSLVYVEGEITYRSYEKDGAKLTATDINVGGINGRVELLKDGKPKGEPEPRRPTYSEQKGRGARARPSTPDHFADDPFGEAPFDL